ncbi:hypothetical protein [Erythrobacter sp. QSSC1-22B]|nr:hypothetical protein [Erythrobacter sp. QSSC1-22B]
MSLRSFRNSNPDPWSVPRPYSDASLRLMKHGRVLPMHDEPGLLRRLLGR